MIDFVKRITKKAGQIALSSPKLIRGRKEGRGNWVTQADLESERFLIQSIKTNFPLHNILSEETLMEKQDFKALDNLWILDPIDGTTNFTFALPLFSVSVAYLKKGIPIYGAVYDPSRDELFYAEKSRGAKLNDKPIRVLSAVNFKGTIVDIGCPYMEKDFKKTYPLGEIFFDLGARITNLGSGALECAYVACGRLALYYENGLKPWDIAAAYLIVTQAGGKMDSVTKPFSLLNSDEIIAGNKTLVAKGKKLIKNFPVST
ncbi:hypothetical protein A3D78_00110 [Candidatus Gottesmanbacteria bacterium RIFCSPHIGHO2_02_FULL_39_14]|uniref:Inositol-1-monophosphatase n=1 Tax=Candidatus Gottesmanbacteria bacterium RIFCSPHIGHO2_02_FULL_39_14 TaxID=1798383 RepID=A0A1F5ZXG3_9BACT|nr:MAG: hypothetical protein A3D78_00110 [Candidatus Gottesmanbacteria bacterium RIFCSPHIGHO2_02_FULL_39_14]